MFHIRSKKIQTKVCSTLLVLMASLGATAAQAGSMGVSCRGVTSNGISVILQNDTLAVVPQDLSKGALENLPVLSPEIELFRSPEQVLTVGGQITFQSISEPERKLVLKQLSSKQISDESSSFEGTSRQIFRAKYRKQYLLTDSGYQMKINMLCAEVAVSAGGRI